MRPLNELRSLGLPARGCSRSLKLKRDHAVAREKQGRWRGWTAWARRVARARCGAGFRRIPLHIRRIDRPWRRPSSVAISCRTLRVASGAGKRRLCDGHAAGHDCRIFRAANIYRTRQRLHRQAQCRYRRSREGRGVAGRRLLLPNSIIRSPRPRRRWPSSRRRCSRRKRTRSWRG